MALRLHLDEHQPHALAAALRRHGIDVTMAMEVGLLGESDESHLAFAYAENRVIVTGDKDFLRLHASGLPHAGIFFCLSKKNQLSYILRSIAPLAKSMDPVDIQGMIHYL